MKRGRGFWRLAYLDDVWNVLCERKEGNDEIDQGAVDATRA